ncbi:MAG: sugar phosphate nucleotidyltransferase [Candidatus Neomarinimicrobiota bacterium]
MNINYKIQDRPSGIPEAFIIGEKFIDNDKCCLILGDNLFFGRELELLHNMIQF